MHKMIDKDSHNSYVEVVIPHYNISLPDSGFRRKRTFSDFQIT